MDVQPTNLQQLRDDDDDDVNMNMIKRGGNTALARCT